jgi:hypothetical protein
MNMLPEFDTADARAGRWDKTTGLQAFARFEAETRKDERERAVKEAEYYAKHSGVARNIAAAIRNLGEGD